MKIRAVVIQKFVLNFNPADTSIQIKNSLRLEEVFQRFIKFAPDTLMPCVLVKINCQLGRILVSLAPDKFMSISIADNFFIKLRHKVGVFFLCLFYSRTEICKRRNFPLKTYRRVQDVVGINFQKFFCVVNRCVSYLQVH